MRQSRHSSESWNPGRAEDVFAEKLLCPFSFFDLRGRRVRDKKEEALSLQE
jgi:hypothetical protein